MIENRDLSSLVEYVGHQPVLSVYLDTNMAQRTKYEARLLLLNSVAPYASAAAEEIKAIQTFLDLEYDWRARGLAIFSSSGELWKVIPLPTSVNTQAYYAERPYVRVLTDLMDRFGQYAVAVLDKESLHLYSVAWGKITSASASLGEALKRHRQEGFYASGYQRHEDNLALHNLKQAAEVIEGYCADTGCKRIVLAGALEAVAQVRGLLSRSMQERVLGEFAADVTASPHDILERSLDIVAQANLAQEQALVEEAITAAAKGGLGVTGVTDALYALHQGRVHILLADEGLQTPGYICDHCGYVLAQSATVCPMCQHKEINETPDVVNRAIQKAHETGAQVTLVRGNEALAQAGGIAAILRY